MQGRQGKRQRWRFRPIPKAGLGDGAGSVSNAVGNLFSDFPVEQAVLFIQVILELLVGLPAGGEGLLVGFFLLSPEPCFNAVIGLGLEVFDGIVTFNHKAKYRSLYPANGIDPLFTLPLITEGIKSGQVDAIEPVGALSGQGGMG